MGGDGVQPCFEGSAAFVEGRKRLHRPDEDFLCRVIGVVRIIKPTIGKGVKLVVISQNQPFLRLIAAEAHDKKNKLFVCHGCCHPAFRC